MVILFSVVSRTDLRLRLNCQYHRASKDGVSINGETSVRVSNRRVRYKRNTYRIGIDTLGPSDILSTAAIYIICKFWNIVLLPWRRGYCGSPKCWYLSINHGSTCHKAVNFIFARAETVNLIKTSVAMVILRLIIDLFWIQRCVTVKARKPPEFCNFTFIAYSCFVFK